MLTRYNHPVEALSSFESFFNTPFWELARPWPVVDIQEKENQFVLTAELPGMKPEDVEVTVKDHTLLIRGKTEEEKKTETEGYHRVERRHGSFQRSFTLPENMEQEHIDAELKDGVLTVVMPKHEVPPARSVKVRTEALKEKAKKLFSKKE